MLPLEVISAMRTFMGRANLQGIEVDAYNKCMAHLHNEERLTRQAAEVEKAAAQRAAAPAEAQPKE